MASNADGAPTGSSITGDISRRIEILRLVLVAGIVFLHVPPTWVVGQLPPEAAGLAGQIKLFLAYGPFRAAVPTLSLISGWLLFRRPPPYPTLLAKKARTLLVPFLIWNVLVALLRLSYGSAGIDELAPGDGLLERVLALVDRPPDHPTYFLLHVFLCAVYSPALMMLLSRAPLLTLAAAAAIVGFGHSPLPLVRPDIALAFACGGAVALHRVDITLLDPYWRPLAITFLAACAVYVAMLPNLQHEGAGMAVLRAAGVPTAWAASSMLVRSTIGGRLAPLGRHAFLLFCAHVPALYLLTSLWPHHATGYWPFFVVAGPLVITGILAGAVVLTRLSPELAGLLSGARLARRLPPGA